MTSKKHTALFKVLDPHQLQVLRGLVAQTKDEFEVHVKDMVISGKDDAKTFATEEQAKAYIGGEFVEVAQDEYDAITQAFEDGQDPRSDAFAPKPYSGEDVSAKTEEEQDEMRKEQEAKAEAAPEKDDRSTENEAQDAGGNVGPAYEGPVGKAIEHPVMAKPE